MDRNQFFFQCCSFSRGQARKSLWIETNPFNLPSLFHNGQARKSLWIETKIHYLVLFIARKVRLVRACGSKHSASRAEFRTYQVRLVRACGSKLGRKASVGNVHPVRLVRACGSKLLIKWRVGQFYDGQARKSLWIETTIEETHVTPGRVRLVRACGSKLAPSVF